MNEIKVGIVDDHSIVRQGLRAILDREPDLRVVGDADAEGPAIAMVDQTRPDVVLMDLRLTAEGAARGLACAPRSRAAFPSAGSWS